MSGSSGSAQFLHAMAVHRRFHSCLLMDAAGSVLDYGCGAKAKLLQRIRAHASPGTNLVGADPCIAHSTQPHSKHQQRQGQGQVQGLQSSASGALLLTADCGWAAHGARLVQDGYDVVVCSLVLCTLADRQEYLAVLDNLVAAVKPGACVRGC